MSGILEKMLHELVQQALPSIVQAVTQQIQGQQRPLQGQQRPVQGQQQPVQQFQQPVQQQGGQVTADMIQSVIGPLVQTEQGKQAVIAAMQGVGVQNLTEARPDQLPALYAAFQQVAANMGGGVQDPQFSQFAQQPVQQQPAAQQGGMSII